MLVDSKYKSLGRSARHQVVANALEHPSWCASQYKAFIGNHARSVLVVMVRNRTIQIRLTREQYERIRNTAEMKGFGSLSSFLRFVALDQDFVLHQKVSEIHAHLLGAAPARKFKRNAALPPSRS
jgi:hypothetical protein